MKITDALFVAGAAVILLTFVVLFYQTASVRWVIQDIERTRYNTPPDGEAPLEVKQCVRAYAFIADKGATAQLERGGSPVLQESMRLVCSSESNPSDAKIIRRDAVYQQPHWLAIRRSPMADAFHEDVRSGRVRYAAIGGALVRIVAATERTALEQGASAALKMARNEFRVFVVAPAYDVPQMTSGDAAKGVCRLDAVLPVPTNPERLWQVLKAPGPAELKMHVWGYNVASDSS